ncbi:NAD(P)-binding domain-containing protein [Streptomyces griseoviridis]|uniref:Pyridine nucleotide-disulfide oxidoreductase n=3 Tax=Streptomyces TaxID=1883 RepID=A0A918LFG6_STRGD|nr:MULTISPECIES: NAD(P)-binding domain-containing protein [Streptomyces]MDP9679581.1 thioredoxin reductase [Streptomyces griseoviridis]GGS40144.1 pyridine nucleotide-disulfide oxidoreductase [Streptomyces niveoruber]GGT00099.1 pyridine nucleotide-disulfide oxidoreductase [Streptomyces griseoviridis]GGU24276.1 pyridine nucleotide-disulfide oxidoreductase [Streptomyces daghestanicus]GHI29851.1 pyridine nucleotide-disulfide oxidoreductase [Streptomyces daghestanicus]
MVRDYLIIGAGPAGLQLAAALERDGRDYAVLERGRGPGTFFTRFPRHRQLISINKVHTGYRDPELRLRMDWNSLLSDDPELLFTRYSDDYFPRADDLVRYLADYAERTGVRAEYGAEVVRVSRPDGVFTVEAADGRTWRARRLIVATGVSRLNVPPIPGIELAERYDDFDTDPASFTDQRVLVIGKGNSAFETAESLMAKAAVIHVAGPHSLRMAWQTHFVGHLRAVNNNFLDSYQLKSQNAVLDGTVESVEKAADGGYRVVFRYARTTERLRELRYDRIILAAGFRFDASVFDDTCRPALVIDDRFPEQTAAYESVNVPDLYFAGTLTQQRDFKKSTNGFIHGFRYGVRALHRILDARYHDTPWPARPLPAAPEAIADAVVERVNRSSGLWQQFGFLGDVVGVDGDRAVYQEEVPLDLVTGGGLGPAAHRFVVDLEYGPGHADVDPFDISVPRVAENDAEHAGDSVYLHPVVRHYRDGVLDGTHHLAENLENDWDIPAVHQQPLTAFVKACLD